MILSSFLCVCVCRRLVLLRDVLCLSGDGDGDGDDEYGIGG